jgi:hypothetical protein
MNEQYKPTAATVWQEHKDGLRNAGLLAENDVILLRHVRARWDGDFRLLLDYPDSLSTSSLERIAEILNSNRSRWTWAEHNYDLAWGQAYQLEPTRDGLEMPELLESAQLPKDLGADASHWLDGYVDFSRRWSPRAYGGFHVACGLWVLSVVAGRRVVLHLGPPRYTPLYIALVARTSLFVKSTTADIAVDVLRATGLDWLLAADDCTPQRFIRSLTLRIPPDFDELPAETQARIELQLGLAGSRGWFYEEFGQKLSQMTREGSFMADFKGILRRFDDCKERYEYATIGRGVDTVERPYLALLACLTPADLEPVSKRGASMWSDGFFARFAFVSPHRDERKRDRFPDGERAIPSELTRPLKEWHERLGVPEAVIEDVYDDERKKTGRKEATVKPLEPATCTLADRVVDAYYNYHDALLDLIERSENTDLDGNYTRFAEKALRVAILLASLENDNHIEMKHWARAQEIAESWRADLHALYHQLNEPDVSEREQQEEKVLQILRRHGQQTAANVARYIRGLDTGSTSVILENLARGGMVNSEKTQRTTYYDLSGGPNVIRVGH